METRVLRLDNLIVSNPCLDEAWIDKLVNAGRIGILQREEPIVVDCYSTGENVIRDGNHFVEALKVLGITLTEAIIIRKPESVRYFPLL